MLLAFHKMLGGGSPLPPLLMLICLAVVPVIALTAPPYAHVLPQALVRGMLVALVDHRAGVDSLARTDAAATRARTARARRVTACRSRCARRR